MNKYIKVTVPRTPFCQEYQVDLMIDDIEDVELIGDTYQPNIVNHWAVMKCPTVSGERILKIIYPDYKTIRKWLDDAKVPLIDKIDEETVYMVSDTNKVIFGLKSDSQLWKVVDKFATCGDELGLRRLLPEVLSHSCNISYHNKLTQKLVEVFGMGKYGLDFDKFAWGLEIRNNIAEFKDYSYEGSMYDAN